MPLRLLLQRLETGPSGVHPDLACDDVEAEAAEHIELGATAAHRAGNWFTMRDPAGLPYCLTRRDPETGTLPT